MIPELIFIYDSSLDRAMALEEIIDKIHEDDEVGDSDQAGDGEEAGEETDGEDGDDRGDL